jgi:hypothetical protein
MKNLWVVLIAAGLVAPYTVRADDRDAEMHSAVQQRVQQDHQSDMKAGKVAHPAAKAAASSSSSTSTSAPAASSHAAAPHPTQVQELKLKKKAPPPPAHH